ncbi:MAG TPA: hypothetical protein VJ714_01490 [Anaerolineae bacterium]|jgi:predicted DNA-binding protein YlxM (UPF0122 family)|nr:hypothetical protein [Anaerolineae bacterium]
MSGKVKKWGLIAGMAGGLAAVLVLGLVVGGVLLAATTASAQETEPTPGPPWEGRGGGMFGWGGGSWTIFDTIAEALGLTPNELFTESHDEGKSVSEIAEERGVELDAVQDAVNASRDEVRREAIAQAVEDGRITQEQADWMLEGIEQGFHMGGRGMGRGGHFGMGGGGGLGLFGPCAPAAEES